ncbi:MAG: hypothetical protein A2Z18_06525 [Armatimonadetes bacterium RBG_16_58_9]|nr:MAG: hypothetical protein A2Z18_06525 [Armatimonadetes bacterium RBG_16_58_9]
MGTEIKTWQIVDGKLRAIDTDLEKQGKTEPYDLEPWIASNPAIVGSDVAIIGRQVMTKSGPIDLLGMDKSGNPIIIELKRGMLPREAVAQAIDYASDVADWTVEKLSEIASGYCGRTLEDLFSDVFQGVDLENLNVNSTQRIILVGFAVESSLERMIEWLSDGFGVNINAIVLNYIKTGSGDELVAKTSIISEELEKERVKKGWEIPMSDDAGNYDEETLRLLLLEYLKKNAITSQRIRDVLLPTLLKKDVVTREQLKKELVKHDAAIEPPRAGAYLTTMSTQLGMKKNDFLRQVVAYEYPTYAWEKDNFAIREEYRQLVERVLEEMKATQDSDR